MTKVITIDYECLRLHCTGYAQEGKIEAIKNLELTQRSFLSY